MMTSVLSGFLWMASVGAGPSPSKEVDLYNVAWDNPSANASGSMPIGNGEMGANVWVEEDGDLYLLLSRTDAWSEACRLLKLGRIRLSLSPNPFKKGCLFNQELKLRQGVIEIEAGEKHHAVRLKVFVDACAPILVVQGESDEPLQCQVQLENWRKDVKILKGEELSSSWTMQAAPDSIEVQESPDTITVTEGTLSWYHRNETSVVPLTLEHQGLKDVGHFIQDPLLHRTFGGRISGKGFLKHGDDSLSSEPVRRFSLQIATQSAQTDSVKSWEEDLQKTSASDDSLNRTRVWWEDFWDRSWVFVEEDAPAGNPVRSRVTQAYVLQRWMAACAGRGNYPIKFNGSLFTVDPQYTDGPAFNPDWRRWGDCYWWQNTRLPYEAMVMSGDFDLMMPLFRLYREVLPLCKARAKVYHHVQGAYFPETMTCFGTYANRDYGWDRTGHAPDEVLCPYWCYAWQQGLELVHLMLRYTECSGDTQFQTDVLIPMAHEVLAYYDSRFGRDDSGRLRIHPTQAAETYWDRVINDTPSVAGLNAVLDRLIALPVTTIPSEEREFWIRLKAAVPAIPLGSDSGKSFILPAESFDPKRSNCENPELYAIWPFKLFGVGRPGLDTGVETWRRRIEKGMRGWSYDGQCAAILGLTQEAREQILFKVGNSHPNHRFPAMWGPNFDWLPDQDHGSNILLTLQHMVMAEAGDKIILLPAWPKDWTLRFKLHASQKTVVSGEVKDGHLVNLKVDPKSRKKDVVVWTGPGSL